MILEWSFFYSFPFEKKVTGSKLSGNAGTIAFSWKSGSEAMTNHLDMLGLIGRG